jgi:outer membrane lipoprotein carrier protein
MTDRTARRVAKRVCRSAQHAAVWEGSIPKVRVRRFTSLTMLALLSLATGVALSSRSQLRGEALGAKPLVGIFEARYRSARTLQATFLERYTENGQTVRTEAGTAYFRRPGKMRWEYESPEKDLFLVDGKTAWFYVPGDHTVTRVPAKQSADWRTPLALLAGEMKVSRVCARVDPAPGEKPVREGDVVLRCQVRGANADSPREDRRAEHDTHDVGVPAPPPGSQGDTVFFEIVRATGDLTRLVVRQSGGIQVEFQFENWRMNPVVPDSLFRFDVPPGVAIVNGELPSGDAGVK